MDEVEIVITKNRVGYPAKGTELKVNKLRAYRWVNDLKIATFKSAKEKKISEGIQEEVRQAEIAEVLGGAG